MIHVPTAPWAHLIFDGLSWMSSAAFGVFLFRWRLRLTAEVLAMKVGRGYFLALMPGAIVGAWVAGSFNTLRQAAASVSHSVVGALAGAIVGVELYKAVRGIRGSTGTLFVGPFALGIVVGRFGCLFAGLPDRTFGIPTSLPWGVDLGDGISRHPVQIYESLAMAGFIAVYVLALARHRAWAFRRSFYALAAWYGAQRFVLEFLKPYPSLLGPFNIFHLICLGLVIYGCGFFLRDHRAERAQNRALSVFRPDIEPVRGLS